MTGRGVVRGDEIMGRSADGETVVLRRRRRRRVPAAGLVQPSFAYVAMPDGRDADPDAGEMLGSTGKAGLREALARVLGEEGAAADLAAEADALLGRRR